MEGLKMSKCSCKTGLTIVTLEDVGEHHHRMCPKYRTEKHPYLFYYEEGVNSFIPAPDEVENIIDLEHSMELGEEVEIRFMRFDMTDEEFNALPVE
jgi:hypothetical protein